MSDHPVFIPFREEHLAGVVTMPDTDPANALVMLLQGMGSPRSHKYTLWTRTARELAARGLASLRLDYQELGDSTGRFAADLDHPPIEEAIASARYVAGVLDLDAVGVVGNCMGARAALGLASREEKCRAVACILPGNLEAILTNDPGMVTTTGADGSRQPSVLSPVSAVSGSMPEPEFVDDFLTAVERTPTLLLHLGSEASYDALLGVVASLEAGAVTTPPRTTHVATIPITQFRLTLAVQSLVIGSIADWMEETLVSTAAERSPLAGTSGSRRKA